ncbi:MAG: SgcJ/EcaC family oxidoreductase [Gemmataceae bacterium]
MKLRILLGGALIAVAAVAWAGGGLKPVAVQEPEKKIDPAEEPILKSADAFVQAFNKGDAKALAAFWTEKGTFTDATGDKSVGREAIEKEFAELFAENKGVQLRIEVEDIKFLSPDVAVEEGVSSLLHADGMPPSESRYTNIHVKKDGKWLLDSVKVSPYVAPTQYGNLKMFEGLIGTWQDEDESGTTTIEFEWAENQNFILVHYSTSKKGVLMTGGTGWIAWDAADKVVRTWMFEGNGGFSQGTWSKADGKWTSKSAAVLPDGKKASVTNVVSRTDGNTIQWEIKDRTLDGKPLPDLKPATMKRVVNK